MNRSLVSVVQEILNLRDTTDVNGTIKSIRAGIPLQGYNVWILACGAVLACIGLDTPSPAVIIGAMLISPLMSPILGIGLSISINDRDNLIDALESFGIMVSATLIVSTLYFILTPLGNITDELLARTQPTTLDVLVAFFGGVAGIVAGSRKDKTNAIPGVAIATALMPPLCTAGYGIANMQADIFLGAIYLFFMNAVFIALSTYLITRFLRFPYTDHPSDAVKRKSVRWITIFIVLVFIPSGYFMWRVISQIRFEQNVETFVEEEINSGSHTAIDFEYFRKDTLTEITLYMTGAGISEDSILWLHDQLANYGLEGCELRFVQNMLPPNEEELISRATLQALQQIKPIIDDKDQIIDTLKSQIALIESDSLPNGQIGKEIHALFPEIDRIIMANHAYSSQWQPKADTLCIFVVDWKAGMGRTTQRRAQERLSNWLQQRLVVDSVEVVGI
ncbi:DUF389 domain-containing protein [Pontibacter sp. G13]|uniref:DUF389 domain-containing protein n=1 Tax=Pontibacter sp. G13 TaxID=3074898 RepID=UPI002889B7D6|nr:DUF389 domain-containing protein [Pontibacter sp. G13]WNJ19417.1 DUF389 domain-containing protein [Pontibacter sp. G13]